MITYEPRDLGYPRTPTTKHLIVTFPNGPQFSVPVQVIVDNRDAYNASDQEDTAGYIERGELDAYEIEDWAANNMDWADMSDYATLLTPEKAYDFVAQWGGAEMEVLP